MFPDLKGLEINTEMSVQYDMISTSSKLGWEVGITALAARAGTSCQIRCQKEVTLELRLEHRYGGSKKESPFHSPLLLASFFHSIEFLSIFPPLLP